MTGRAMTTGIPKGDGSLGPCKPTIKQFTVRALISLAAVAASTMSLNGVPALAFDEWPGGYKPITNAQFFGNHATPEVNMMLGEYAYKERRYDDAIALLRETLDGDDEEIDAHKFLALSLEGKMKKQAEKDPSMFEECVKEWLIVLRNERGPEKGLSLANGRTVSAYSNRFADEMGSMMARQHLIKLTGRAPKDRETDAKFIKLVTQPAQERVKGKIINRPSMQEEEGGEFTPQ